MILKKLIILFGLISICAASASAGIIYELINGGGQSLAELELAVVPAGAGDILDLRLTAAGLSELATWSAPGGTGTGWSPSGGGTTIIEQPVGGLMVDAPFTAGSFLKTGPLPNWTDGIEVVNQIEIFFSSNDMQDVVELVGEHNDQLEGNWQQKPGQQPIPEPSTYALFAMGILGLGIAHRRRKARS